MGHKVFSQCVEVHAISMFAEPEHVALVGGLQPCEADEMHHAQPRQQNCMAIFSSSSTKQLPLCLTTCW